MAASKRMKLNLNSFLPLVLSGNRSLIGLLWLASLRWKLPPTFEAAGDHRSLMEWMQLQVAHPTLDIYGDFVATVVIPNFTLFAWMVFMVELAIGLSLTFGLFSRLGAALGLLWSFNLALGLLAVPGEWPWSYLMLIMWQGLFLVSTDQQHYSLDRLLQRRKNKAA